MPHLLTKGSYVCTGGLDAALLLAGLGKLTEMRKCTSPKRRCVVWLGGGNFSTAVAEWWAIVVVQHSSRVASCITAEGDMLRELIP